MKIGMILDKEFPPDPRVENEAIELVKAGNEVFLFCLTYGNEPNEELINGIQVIRYCSNKLEYKFSALAYTVPVYTMVMQKKIAAFINSYAIEALHIHDIRIAQAAFNANKKFQLPTVLDLHDNFPEVMQFYPHLQKFPGKYIISPKKWKQKEEDFIKQADKVITVSPDFVEEVIERTKIPNDKIVLVPNTIRKSFYEDFEVEEVIINKYKNDFVILYLGDTHIRRGLLTAIRALPKLSQEIPNVKLVIVGKNTTDTILKAEVKALNVTQFVDFEGWQNVALFPTYIQASSICISPLYRNIQHDVAYANKLFQYMSLAKPVLVSNAIAQKRLVEKYNAGLVHIEKDVEDFSNKILQLYSDKILREELGANGKDFVHNHFTWDVTSKRLIELYNQLT